MLERTLGKNLSLEKKVLKPPGFKKVLKALALQIFL